MMARAIYDEEHELYRENVRRFLEKEAVPHHESWEHAGITPRSFWLRAGEEGLLCPHIPEEFGGAGGDYRYLAIVGEEAARAGITAANFAVHSDIAASYVAHYGTPAQKKRYLPDMVAGRVLGSIAMSEPSTGSDLRAIRTSAERTADGYVINGSKTFITGGINTDLCIVVARTADASGQSKHSLFLVPADTPGFVKSRKLEKLGLKGQDTAELFFDNVKLPADALLGEEHKGFQMLTQELPRERLAIAVLAVASSQRAFDLAVDYTQKRKAFGQRLIDFQNTRFKLADIRADLLAGWAFLDRCITDHVAEKLDVPTAAAAKLWTTELQCRVVDDCLQMFGGYGYMLEYPISKMFADARIQRIYGGTSEIMREIVARDIDSR